MKGRNNYLKHEIVDKKLTLSIFFSHQPILERSKSANIVITEIIYQ